MLLPEYLIDKIALYNIHPCAVLIKKEISKMDDYGFLIKLTLECEPRPYDIWFHKFYFIRSMLGHGRVVLSGDQNLVREYIV